MSISSDVGSMMNAATEGYTVTSSIGDNGNGGITTTTSKVTGDRENNKLFVKKDSTGFSKDAFFKLLTTQLQYQDPSSPMDGSQMQAQLAQFAELESTQNMQKALESMASGYGKTLDVQTNAALSTTNAASVSLIGKVVRLAQTSVTVTQAGESNDIQVHLGNASTGSLQILDDTGNVLQTLDVKGKDSQNNATVTWNGRDANGNLLEVGKYNIKMVGSESNGELYCFAQDTVQGVRYTSSGPMLKVSGKELPISNVLDVAVGDSSGSSLNGVLGTGNPMTLLNHNVRVSRDSVTNLAQNGQEIPIHVNLGDQTAATVEVVNAAGTVVRTFTARHTSSDADGTATVTWNGLDSAGENMLPAGRYKVRVQNPTDDTGLYIYDEGAVKLVSTYDGVTKARVNDDNVPLSKIIAILSETTGA